MNHACHTAVNDTPVITPWPRDKRWAYSITFDEGLVELHRFTIPILARYGVPGHVEVVVGHMGVVRQLGASSYNGYTHMGPEQLRDLLDRGWGVGTHTWTHDLVTEETVDHELGDSKKVLEEALRQPVTIYCSAGDNSNMSGFVLDACKRYGYLGAMSITDALNRPADKDLLWLNRTFLHTQGYAPFFSEFDPYRNITHACKERGWMIDYLHCPFEKAVHPNKDCSADELLRRIEAVCGVGGADVWLAKVEDAVDYRYTRRAAVIDKTSGNEYRLSAPGLHAAVARRTVTVALPAGTSRAWIDGQRIAFSPRGGKILIDIDLARPRVLRVEAVALPTIPSTREH
jgi:peptidoglycan/xylan/chitin deacetylase (PgdA/CDA1 family)